MPFLFSGSSFFWILLFLVAGVGGLIGLIRALAKNFRSSHPSKRQREQAARRALATDSAHERILADLSGMSTRELEDSASWRHTYMTKIMDAFDLWADSETLTRFLRDSVERELRARTD